MLSQDRLTVSHPLLRELVNGLIEQGICPNSASVNVINDIDAIHQWLISAMPGDDPVLWSTLEGFIMQEWADRQLLVPFDQITVSESVNAFEYDVMCHIRIGQYHASLRPHDPFLATYDPSCNEAFLPLFDYEWASTSTLPLRNHAVDYAQADTYLTLDSADQLALDAWLDALFVGQDMDTLSDDQIMAFIYNELVGSGAFRYQEDAFQLKSLNKRSSPNDSSASSDHQSNDSSPDDSKDQSKKESFQQSYLDDNADDDGNAFDKTVYNVVDDWASMASFLDTKSGDCEDFSHLFYHALNRVYDRIDNRSVPSARLSSGMVRGEFSSVGHSVVEVMVDDNWRVIDCTNGPQGFVNGFSDFLTRSEYRQATCYDAYIEYQYGETKRFKDDQTLASFSTASLFKSPNANGLKDAKFKHYDDLRDRVYKLEQKKQTSQGIRSMNSISLTELEYMLEGSSLESVAQQIWELLQSLRLVSDTGQVNSDTVHSDRYMARFRSDMNGLIDPDDSTADLVADIELLLVNRAHVFSRQNNDNESASGLRETLQSFDALSEDLLSELTKSTTPNYVDSSSFVSCPKDSLFIRVDHERMQSMLSQFFQLQHTISAFMTVAFSISDTVSSIAAKLGDDSSLASSTAQQRQKIIKSFNSFSSGVNESVNTLMDLFLETVTTTNKARYQTAVSQIKLEFSDFSSQLTDEFFSKESKIQEEELMMKLSKDYYKMLYDNRLSMQKATLDVPDFGPSILPTRFANMLQGTEFSSEDVFDYLLTQGFIDEHGTVTELGARVSVDLINDDQFYVIREDIVHFAIEYGDWYR